MANPTLNATGQGVAEMQYGRYTHLVQFSGISTCTTLTCVLSGGNRLLAAHFPLMQQPHEYDAALNAMGDLMNGDQVVEMYIVRVADAWGAQSIPGVLYDPRFLDANQADTFRTALGYAGPVHVRETEGNDGEASGGNVVRVQWLRTLNRSRVSVDGQSIHNFTVVPALPQNAVPLPPNAPAQQVQMSVQQKIKLLLRKAFPCVR